MMVYNNSNPEINGRIKINFYREGVVLVANTMTEDDGYFNFQSLAPGNYTARVNGTQLDKIKIVTLQ